MKFTIVSSLLLICLSTFGATYYVSTNGNDSAAGSSVAPWLTVQKAANTATNGDTVYISQGNYPENVTSAQTGVAGTYIRFFGNPTNTTFPVISEFRLTKRAHFLSGLKFKGGASGNNASVRLDFNGSSQDGSHSIISNCWFEGMYLVTTNASFGSNYIQITDANFNSAGFLPGHLVFLGSDTLNQYTNHDASYTVLSNSVDGKRMYVTTNFVSDPGTNYWAVIYAGQDNSGYKAILIPPGPGITAASNVTIVANTFSNTFGHVLSLRGENHYVADNTFKKFFGYYWLVPQTRFSTYERNLAIDSPGIIWFSQDEIDDPIYHPPGGNSYDYSANQWSNQIDDAGTNYFRRNWMQGLYNQAGQLTAKNRNNGWVIESNVWVGVEAAGGISANDVTFRNNTAYRVGYNYPHSYWMGIGGVSTNIQTGLILSNNLAIDIGSKATPAVEGPWTITQSTNYLAGGNVSAESETMGFGSYTTTAPGVSINGVNPVFRDIRRPLGADGIPFTADDGLMLLPSSPLAASGIGALGVTAVSAGTPIAHFVPLTSTWADTVGTNYNPAWFALRAWARGGPLREWDVPEVLGGVPCSVTFSASNSIGGLTTGSTNTDGIVSYTWDFGDGATWTSRYKKTASHVYCSTGQVWVSLTVSNSAGGSASYSNLYSIKGTAAGFTNTIWHVAQTGNDTNAGTQAAPLRTTTNVATRVNPGDYVAIKSGLWTNEIMNMTRAASASNRITVCGYGATLGGVEIRQPYYTFEGLNTMGNLVGTFGAHFYIYPTAHYTTITKATFSEATNRLCVLFARGANGVPGLSASFCTVTDNTAWKMDYTHFLGYGGTNTISYNYASDANGQPDFTRIWGKGHRIAWNVVTNQSALVENHTDFYQIYGPNPAATTNDFDVAQDIMIDHNVYTGSRSQICQLENYDTPAGYFSNIVFFANVFNVNSAGSLDIDGTKWLNNTFFRCTTNTGHVFSWGGTKGSAYGTEYLNNAFVKCGDDTSNTGRGWYSTDPSVTNYSVLANYDFVTGTNYTSKAEAPPDSLSRWKSFGWEANGINGGDPGFINETTLNLRLQTNSILLSVGTNLTTRLGSPANDFLVDLDFQALPPSGMWPIGPYLSSAPASPSTGNFRFYLQGRINTKGKVNF